MRGEKVAYNKNMKSASFPYCAQETDFYCGPAVAQMLLKREGTHRPQSTLAAALGTNKEVGTTMEALERLLRHAGFRTTRRAKASLEDVRAALARNEAVIVGYLEPRGDEPHYALVAGIEGASVRLIDPLMGSGYALPTAEFERRWRDNEHGAYGERAMLAAMRPTVPSRRFRFRWPGRRSSAFPSEQMEL